MKYTINSTGAVIVADLEFVTLNHPDDFTEFADIEIPASLDARAEILRLETEQLMPRATREFMLLSMESMFTPDQLSLNPGYAAVKAFDTRIAELRALL